ncbi:hypothetical protein FRC08_005366 [Ceratobasidium sp. 394]|nr:hypothetical protein FRC08_005366 [Ceratobasidium sp. 394]
MSTSAGSAAIGIRYVDVNETHVFVVVAAVAKAAVSVYSRGTGQCVFRLTPEQLNRFCSSAHLPTRIEDSGNSFFRLALHHHSPTPTLVYPAPPEDQVMVVHVSPTGRDFVAATFCGYVLHVTGFDSTYQVTERGQLPARPGRPKISVTRVFNSRTTHLAYDGEHIVVTTTQGVCMATLRPSLENDITIGTDPGLYPFPAQFASLVPPFAGGYVSYDGTSCIQLTKEGFWVAWQANLPIGREVPFRRPRKTIGMIDFTRPRMPNLGPSSGSKARRLSWG